MLFLIQLPVVPSIRIKSFVLEADEFCSPPIEDQKVCRNNRFGQLCQRIGEYSKSLVEKEVLNLTSSPVLSLPFIDARSSSHASH